MKIRSRNVILLYLLALLFTVGTLGYMLILQVPFVDALYMTIITVSTVGFREVQELDTLGKLFTIVIITWGLGIVAYAFSQLAAFLAEGEFKRVMRERRIERRLQMLKDHYIICGAGQTSVSLIEQFDHSGVEYVIIEEDPDRCEELQQQDCTVVRGDATNEEVLERAGIMQAKGLAACLDSDSENVFTVLTARGMNSTLQIVARAKDASTPRKLLKAGANSTISPNELGGNRMAFMLLRPQVISFLDTLTRMGDDTLDLGEIQIKKGSPLEGKSLQEARIPEKTGLMVLAVKDENGSTRFNPKSTEVLTRQLSMLVLGKQEQITSLQRMAEGA
ncbi:MAG: potassium channel family protein [Spirochaetota bacterium]